MKYIYDKEANYITTILVDDEEKIREQYKDVYISNVFIHNAIIDVTTNEIREMTRVELIIAGLDVLQDGEYIENNEIITVEKTNDFSIWDKEKHEWIYNVALELEYLMNQLIIKESQLNDLYDILDKAIARRLKALERDTQSKIDAILLEIEELEKRKKELTEKE